MPPKKKVQAKAADDDDDEDEDHDVAADGRRQRLPVERPHDAAETRERGSHDEDADEEAADPVAQRLDHLGILDAPEWL